MIFFGRAKPKLSLLCVDLLPDRVDITHVMARGRARAEVLSCDSYEKDKDDVTTLKRLKKKFDFARHACTTLLRPGEYRIIKMEAPKVAKEELKQAVRWRVKEWIDYPIDQAMVDSVSVPEESTSTEPKQIIAVAAANELIAKKVKPFIDADIPLDVIDIPEMAQRNIARLLETENRGLTFLSFNERGGLLTFTCNGELYHCRQIDLPVAEFHNESQSARHQAYDRVVLELQRSLDQFELDYKRFTVSKIVVVPVPGADELIARLKAEIGTEVVTLDLSAIVSFPHAPELRKAAGQSKWLHMIGAAMREEAPA